MYRKPAHRMWAKLSGGALCPHEELWALRHVYLNVSAGSTMGVVGPNGAGKSTLLRLLTGITQPTEGTLQVEGRVTGILELGTGFHPEFSGTDNALMNLALQGFDRATSESLLPEIISFSGLKDVMARPLKTYSTGMSLRLAFAVATCAMPDILVVDEALAVGDEAFRHRCMGRIAELKQGGATIVLVSHDLTTVRHMCSQVLLLDRGRPKAAGAPEDVLDTYLELVREREAEVKPDAEEEKLVGSRWGSGEVRFSDVEVLDDNSQPVQVVDTGGPLRLRLTYAVTSPIQGIVFGVGIYRSDGTYVHGSNHYWREDGRRLDLPRADTKGEIVCRIPAFPLLPGTYDVSAYAYAGYDDIPRAVDHWERATRFKVSERESGQHGIVHLETEWELNGNT